KRKTGTDMQKTILVAEDVESNFLLLKALIGKSYNLLRAYTGVDAVRLFHEKQPDLILMDIKMPEMDGLEATAEIRKTSTQIPIIALTAFAFNDDRTEALNAGCNDYLTKPVSAELLKQTIEKYI
ncbi:MAG: response regulator, partial [Bacteroidales bacterium]|nr:response regulator [Bacteroidales bacterium]